MTAAAASPQLPGLLFIVNSLETGGAEKQVVTLLNHIDTRRFRLHLAYLKRNETLLGQLRTERLDEVVCCDVSRRIDRGAVGRLRALISQRCIDALVCTNPYSMLYGHLARGVRPGTRLAAVFHSTVLHSFKERLQMLLYRRLFNRCDLLIYVCENQRRYWRQHGLHAPDTVIYNGVDADYFTDGYTSEQRRILRNSLELDANDYVVGLCSALRPEKAADDLLQAIAQLRRHRVPAKALFIGDGPERARIERTAEMLGLRPHVRITGFQRDIRPFTACCDVMALVSHSETFSLAALEGMALGKPVVLSDTGGAAELVVPGEHGFLFEPGDTETLATHLTTLTSHSIRARLGAAAARRVRERFTVRDMASGFADHIGRLLEKPAQRECTLLRKLTWK
ncbi:MAG TPA: glycosyltransferase [Steroidobacteraceae bacterium]|nr:glycosyltransferase [Steroidobacteraceae bacterium]